MTTLKGNEVKAILKKAGFDTRSIKVTTKRSFYHVTLSDWNMSSSKICEALKHLNTVENISHDLDPIYSGDTVCVTYNTKTISEDLKAAIRQEIQRRPQFSVYDFKEVQLMARDLLALPNFAHLTRFTIQDAIMTVCSERN
jgi:hypothetical protein